MVSPEKVRRGAAKTTELETEVHLELEHQSSDLYVLHGLVQHNTFAVIPVVSRFPVSPSESTCNSITKPRPGHLPDAEEDEAEGDRILSNGLVPCPTRHPTASSHPEIA